MGISSQNGVEDHPVNLNRCAFSVDVEDYFQVSAFETVVDRSDWDSIPGRVERNTDLILELLSEYNVTGTFFVLGWVAERYPNIVRRIAADGHELACHGYSHQRIYTQDKNQFAQEVHRSKSTIEDCSGQSVVGYRAASFSITKSSLWALDILAEEGFVYDSSIYPVWHDNYGIPGAEQDPSILNTPKGKEIVEFPLSTFSLMGFPLPVAGGGYFRLYPYWLTRRMLQAIQDRGRPVNFYCHPWELDVGQPKFHQASWKSRFRHYNNIEKVDGRLRKLLQDFQFTTCLDVLHESGLVKEDGRTNKRQRL